MKNSLQRTQHNNILKHHWLHQRSSFSYFLDDDLNLSCTHLQGCTAQTVHKHHIGRIISFTAGILRRWSSQTIQLKNNEKITIISAYWSCLITIDSTTKTIVTQQFKAYQRKNVCCYLRTKSFYDSRLFILNQQILEQEVLLGTNNNLDHPVDSIFE